MEFSSISLESESNCNCTAASQKYWEEKRAREHNFNQIWRVGKECAQDSAQNSEYLFFYDSNKIEW